MSYISTVTIKQIECGAVWATIYLPATRSPEKMGFLLPAQLEICLAKRQAYCLNLAEAEATFLGRDQTIAGWPVPIAEILIRPAHECPADYLGLTAEPICRLFSKLKAREIMELPKAVRVILHGAKELIDLSPLTTEASDW